jgi:hypothetical protein
MREPRCMYAKVYNTSLKNCVKFMAHTVDEMQKKTCVSESKFERVANRHDLVEPSTPRSHSPGNHLFTSLVFVAYDSTIGQSHDNPARPS